MGQKVKYYWRSILWLVIILYLSAIKFAIFKTISPQLNADKWGHFVMYFILSLVIFYDYTQQKNRRSRLFLFICTFIFPLLFGGLMELIQHFFIPYRTGSWMDELANFSGITTAYILSNLFPYIRNYFSDSK